MSLRYASRVVVQSGARAVQGIRDRASRSLKDTATTAASSSSSSAPSSAANSNRVRRLPAARPSTLKAAVAAGEEKMRRAEEDLRTVMFLSCWGPN